MIPPRRRRPSRALLVGGAILLVAAHGIVLHVAAPRVTLPATIGWGVVVLVVLKHLGLLGSLRAWSRRRLRALSGPPEGRPGEGWGGGSGAT